jgi:hypothetical protein
MSNTDLTKNQGVSSGACEVSAVPASWDSILKKTTRKLKS